jgi:hypothetical protein
MRKVKVKWIFRASITMLLAALLTAFQAAAAQAITNTPSCGTDQMTGQLDCGGGDIFWEAGIGLGSGLVFCFIYAIWKNR